LLSLPITDGIPEALLCENPENDGVIAFGTWLYTEQEADLMPQFKTSSGRSLESHPGKNYTEFRWP